jgi:hypothetical protein
MEKNTIDEATAISWISAWRAKPVAGIKAYFIPIADLAGLMKDTKCIGVRAYLAFGGIAPNQPEAKLLFVDVDSSAPNGKDMIGNGIYDFTKPCPTYCDVNSPIYKLDRSVQYPVVPGKTIDIQTAVDWATNWQATPDNSVKAYFILKEVIQQLLLNSNSIGVRAYLGWGTSDPKVGPEAKLMLVSVEGDIKTGGTDNVGKGIFDFTKPCPAYCDTTSSLLTLQR